MRIFCEYICISMFKFYNFCKPDILSKYSREKTITILNINFSLPLSQISLRRRSNMITSICHVNTLEILRSSTLHDWHACVSSFARTVSLNSDVILM